MVQFEALTSFSFQCLMAYMTQLQDRKLGSPLTDKQRLTYEYLLNALGPAPTVAKVSQLLGETPSTTWRKLDSGQLKVLPGTGITRVSIESLLEYLTSAVDYEITHSGRGRKKGAPAK
jgi:hypothetical protein